MRVWAFLFLAILFAISASGAYADDKVLLPACESDNCSSPNLGLNTGADPAANKDSVAAPKPSLTSRIITSISNALPNLGLSPSSKPKQETPAPNATPTKRSTTAKSVLSGKDLSPGGTISPDYVSEEQRMNDLMRAVSVSPEDVRPNLSDPTVKKLYDEQQRLNDRPPLIINDIDPVTFTDDKVSDKYPNNLKIAVAPGYVWGSDDVDHISSILGYKANQIPSRCQLRLDTKLSTNDGLFLTNVYAGQQGSLAYRGDPQAISFVARAVCETPSGTLPSSGQIINRVGNKLGVQLRNTVTCTTPSSTTATLEVQYMGDGTSECKLK